MSSLLIKFLLAHVIGDFLLQPKKWVLHKNDHKERSFYLYIHILIHFALLWLVTGFDPAYWLGILIITVSHLIIDILKLRLTTPRNGTVTFLVDQVLHIVVITAIVSYYEPIGLSLSALSADQWMLTAIVIVLITSGSSILIRTIVAGLNMEFESKSLPNAGRYIGYLERLFILGFILIGYFQGIGFLLAAKSVFRFGDLSKADDRKLTEYMLIGSLLSFGLGISLSYGYLYLLQELSL